MYPVVFVCFFFWSTVSQFLQGYMILVGSWSWFAGKTALDKLAQNRIEGKKRKHYILFKTICKGFFSFPNARYFSHVQPRDASSVSESSTYKAEGKGLGNTVYCTGNHLNHLNTACRGNSRWVSIYPPKRSKWCCRQQCLHSQLFWQHLINRPYPKIYVYTKIQIK